MEPNILDVRWLPSPFNIIKVRLTLEKIGNGEFIEVLLESGKPFNEISQELKKSGCKITRIEKVKNLGDSCDYKLWIQKEE